MNRNLLSSAPLQLCLTVPLTFCRFSTVLHYSSSSERHNTTWIVMVWSNGNKPIFNSVPHSPFYLKRGFCFRLMLGADASEFLNIVSLPTLSGDGLERPVHFIIQTRWTVLRILCGKFYLAWRVLVRTGTNECSFSENSQHCTKALSYDSWRLRNRTCSRPACLGIFMRDKHKLDSATGSTALCGMSWKISLVCLFGQLHPHQENTKQETRDSDFQTTVPQLDSSQTVLPHIAVIMYD